MAITLSSVSLTAPIWKVVAPFFDWIESTLPKAVIVALIAALSAPVAETLKVYAPSASWLPYEPFPSQRNVWSPAPDSAGLFDTEVTLASFVDVVAMAACARRIDV